MWNCHWQNQTHIFVFQEAFVCGELVEAPSSSAENKLELVRSRKLWNSCGFGERHQRADEVPQSQSLSDLKRSCIHVRRGNIGWNERTDHFVNMSRRTLFHSLLVYFNRIKYSYSCWVLLHVMFNKTIIWKYIKISVKFLNIRVEYGELF